MAGAALLLAIATAACDATVARPPEAVLRTGYDTLDGALPVWPARGALIGDEAAVEAVTAAVRDWRSPIDDRVHLPSSGILWFGEADGAPLALVAANVPGQAASWLLQLTGQGTRYEVTRAIDYADPGYLVYSDVIPVQLASGRRYLTSARVERLLGPDGTPVASGEGLSAPVTVPECDAVTLTVRLRPTETIPEGDQGSKLVDLGTGIPTPRYPLITDDSGAAEAILDELNTCVLAGRDGAFGSTPRRHRDRNHWESAPASWPIDRLATKSLGQIPYGDDNTAELEQLSWRTEEGTMTAVMVRPEDGPPVASPSDRPSPLQTYELPSPTGAPLIVLVWRASTDSALSVPVGTVRRVDRPGLVVAPRPEQRITVTLNTADESIKRTLGGPD
jgi:hypothetical protein